MDYMTESLGIMYCVLGTRGGRQRTAVFWPGIYTIERPIVSQITKGPLALSVLHSRSHGRDFGVSFPKQYCFPKYDTVFFFFNQNNFCFLHLFWHILLVIIVISPMVSLTAIFVTDRNIEQLLTFVD
jgi:hypothetical protein